MHAIFPLFTPGIRRALAFTIIGIVLLTACQGINPQAPLSESLTAQSLTASSCIIKVGVINAASLPQGVELQRGYEIARDEINASGGIANCQLSIISEDDQNDPNKASLAAQKLIHKDKVPLLVGSFSSPCSLAIAGEAEKNGIPFIVPNSTSSLITQQGYQYTFRLPADANTMLKAAFDWLDSVTETSSPPTLAILYEYNLAGSSMASSFLNLAAEYGWSVLDYKKIITDLPEANQKEQIATIVDILHNTVPDVIFITADSAENINFLLQQIHEKNIYPKAIIGITGAFNNADFLTRNQNLAEQVIVVNQWTPEVPWEDEFGRTSTHFIEEYQKRYTELPSNRSVQAYTSLKIAKTALEQALPQNHSELSWNLYNALRYYAANSIFGEIQFDTRGQNDHQVIITQVYQGENHIVFPTPLQTRRSVYPILRSAATINRDTGGLERPPSEHSILQIGSSQVVTNFNPLWAALDSERNFFRQIYDTLFEIGPSGAYIPLLAQGVTRSEDGRSFTINLPQNVMFHDDKPLTAKDVVFSYKLYQTVKDSVRHNEIKTMENIVAADDFTVIISFKDPVFDIGDKLSQLYILPEHIWAPIATDESALKSYTNLPPIGSGAFIFKEQNPGISLNMLANKTHWKRPPRVDEMAWQFFTVQDQMLGALEDGDLDAVNSVSPAAVNSLKSLPGIQVFSGTPLRPSFVDIILNQIDKKNCPPAGKCSGHPALQDVRLRQALAYATDKKKIIRVTVLGMATPGITIVPTSLEKLANTKLEDYPFNLTKAAQLLDEAGYKDTNNDGVRETPDGKQSLTFRLYYPANTPKFLYGRMAELLNETWSTIGIRLNILAVNESDLVNIVNPGFEHDIVLWGWGVNPNPDFILSVPTTGQIWGGNSETGYSNPEYDLLYEQQTSEQDPFKRQTLVWKMQEVLMRDVVYIVPYNEQITCAVRADRYKGWDLNPQKLMLEQPEILTRVEPIQ